MTEIIAFISHVAFDYLVPAVLVLGLIAAVFGSILCIHFNYYYYLLHGEILWDMASDKPNEVGKVTEMYSLKWTVGVLDTTLATGFITLLGLLASIMWPVSVILICLLIILQIEKLIFRGRHSKLQFERRLKGLHRD